MRWQIILFAAYLFSLALVPCGDNGVVVLASDAPTVMHQVNPDHQHQDSEHQDHCTLFCVCACCSAVVGTPPASLDLYAEIVPLPPAGKTVPTFTRHWTPQLAADGTWQPPRA